MDKEYNFVRLEWGQLLDDSEKVGILVWRTMSYHAESASCLKAELQPYPHTDTISTGTPAVFYDVGRCWGSN